MRQLDLDDAAYVSDEIDRQLTRTRVQVGDVLLNITGASIGRVATFNLTHVRANVNQHVCVIRPKPDRLSGDFLSSYIATSVFQGHINRIQAGGTRQALNFSQIAEFEIPLPSLDEQRRIATILDQAEALRAKRRQALAKLDTLTQSLFLEMFGDPLKNPRGFERRKMGELIEFVGGSQPPKAVFSDTESAETIRLIQIRDFKSDRYKTFIPKSLARRTFREDDVMIGRYGPPVFQILRGLCGSYNVALMKAAPRSGVLKSFIFHLLRDPGVQKIVIENSERTAGQSGVNLTLLEKLDAYLPPIEIQEAFTRLERGILASQRETSFSDQRLAELAASLQHRAFRGEL